MLFVLFGGETSGGNPTPTHSSSWHRQPSWCWTWHRRHWSWRSTRARNRQRQPEIAFVPLWSLEIEVYFPILKMGLYPLNPVFYLAAISAIENLRQTKASSISSRQHAFANLDLQNSGRFLEKRFRRQWSVNHCSLASSLLLYKKFLKKRR